jgi:hypothetical protein
MRIGRKAAWAGMLDFGQLHLAVLGAPTLKHRSASFGVVSVTLVMNRSPVGSAQSA